MSYALGTFSHESGHPSWHHDISKMRHMDISGTHPNWSTKSFARLLAPGPFFDLAFLTPPLAFM